MCLIFDSTGIQWWANRFSVHEADFFKIMYKYLDFQIRIFVQFELYNAKS